MSISDKVRMLMEIGAPQEAILAVVEAYEIGVAAGKATAPAVDPVAEKRRAYDRERKAKKKGSSGGIPVETPEEHPAEDPQEKAELVLPSPDGPLSLPHTPTLTPLNPPSTSNDTGGTGGHVLEFPKAKAVRDARKTLLPADFILTPERLAFARKEGLTDEAARRQFSKFTASAEAHGRKYANWDRAWENWVRTSIDGFGRARESAPGGHGTSSGGRFGAMQRALARVSNPDLLPE